MYNWLNGLGCRISSVSGCLVLGNSGMGDTVIYPDPGFSQKLEHLDTGIIDHRNFRKNTD